MPNYVAGYGNLAPKLLIVGDSPDKFSSEAGRPFIGPAGELLDGSLFKAGIHRNDCYATYLIKCRVPGNDFEKLSLIGESLEDSLKELWENEIKVLKPNALLLIGNETLKAICGFSGILDYRGSILAATDGITKCIPTINPGMLFHGYASGGLEWTYVKLFEHDVNRAVEESNTSSIITPDRTLSVIHSSLDYYRYFNEYHLLDKAAMDIESINCVPVCIGFAFNRHHAISVPLLKNIGSVKLTDMGDNELDEIWKITFQKLSTLKLVGHNLKYDEFKLTLIRFGNKDFSTMNVFSDTLIKTRVIFPELPQKRLCDVASLWTREPFYKDEGREFKLGKHRIDRLLLYNAKDCAVEIEIDEEQENDLIEMSRHYSIPLKDYYYNYMMKKHKLYIRMENRGFAVNLPRQQELKEKYSQFQTEAHEKLTSLIGYDVNVKSYPQVFNLLYKDMKFHPFKKNPTSEDSIVRLISNHAKTKEKKEILTLILEERRIRDQKSRYINFKPDYDGTCKTIYNISSTETCRSSTGVLDKPLRPSKSGLSFHTISAHGRLAKDIKSMFVPRKGKVFIKADSSQAEARVVAVLARQWDLLDVMDRVDVHRRTAALVLGLTPTLDLTPSHLVGIDDMGKDSPERFTGKKVRHAGNYRMGRGRFMLEFNTDAQKFGIPDNISEWKAGQLIARFRSADDRLAKNFWHDIEEELKSSRCLIDPFGGIRIFNGVMDETLFKEGYANIPQRTVAHLVQGAALAIESEIKGEEGYFIGEKHDELIMEVPEKDYESYGKLLKKYMETAIDFSKYCNIKRDYILVIPCDVEVSDTHYGDFRKVKL